MISIREVAKLAGVSPATVSRVMNGTAKVNPEKEARIRRVIEETGFVPNETARVLFRKSSKTIGVVMPSIRNPYFTELAAYIDSIAQEHGFRALLCCTDYSPDLERAAIQMLMGNNADAIIVASCSEQMKKYLEYCTIPVIALDAMLMGNNVKASVFCDYYMGGRLAMDHLLECGCKNIVCIKGPQYRYSAQTRYHGYLDICKEKGLPEQTVECDYDFDRGIAMTEELLNKYPNVDGIIACNDIVAISTFKVLYQRGISVPRDIQLIGFDDISCSSLLSPELTTIQQPIKEMAEKAIDLIVNEDLTEISDMKFVFPVSLVQRQTTRKQ